MAHAVVGAIRAALAAHADPVRAPLMQACMKSAMPYRGGLCRASRTFPTRSVSVYDRRGS